MRKFENINKDIDNDIPDISMSISNQIDWTKVKESNKKKKSAVREREIVGVGNASDTVVFKSNKKRNIATAIALMVAVLALVIIFAVLPLFNTNVVDNGYTITISVNPRISFDVDDAGIVTKQTALNGDGAKVLFGVDHVGKTYVNATSDYIKTAEKMGYISVGDKVSIYASNGNKNDTDKVKGLSDVLKGLIEGVDFGAMTESDFDKIEDQLDDFDEETFTNENMENLIAAVRAELDKKTVMLNAIIDEMKNVIDKKPITLNNKNDSDDEVKIPASEVTTLKKLIDEYVLLYNDEDMKEYEFSDMTYKELIEKQEELEEIKEELIETLDEIKEITDINQVGDDKKDLIEDLLDIVKEDIFDKD